MNEEKNDQEPKDEPPPATPDIQEKGMDTESQEPPRATQDIMEFAEEPPKAKQDIIMKMMTQEDLDKLRIQKEEKGKEEVN